MVDQGWQCVDVINCSYWKRNDDVSSLKTLKLKSIFAIYSWKYSNPLDGKPISFWDHFTRIPFTRCVRDYNIVGIVLAEV